jgi:hypothetical protein
LANVTQLVVNITIDQQALSRVFRHARNDPVSWPNAPTVTITGTPELIVGYYTVNPLQKIPPLLSYKYYSIVNCMTKNTSQALPAVGSSFTMTSNAIQLQSIPRAVLISVTKSSKTLQDPDAYFPFGTIQASQPQNTQGVLSINFNNEVFLIS